MTQKPSYDSIGNMLAATLLLCAAVAAPAERLLAKGNQNTPQGCHSRLKLIPVFVDARGAGVGPARIVPAPAARAPRCGGRRLDNR